MSRRHGAAFKGISDALMQSLLLLRAKGTDILGVVYHRDVEELLKREDVTGKSKAHFGAMENSPFNSRFRTALFNHGG